MPPSQSILRHGIIQTIQGRKFIVVHIYIVSKIVKKCIVQKTKSYTAQNPDAYTIWRTIELSNEDPRIGLRRFYHIGSSIHMELFIPTSFCDVHMIFTPLDNNPTDTSERHPRNHNGNSYSVSCLIVRCPFPAGSVRFLAFGHL